MDYLHNIILGIIQGLTEFLPVSSSGHLELAEYFLGVEATEDDILRTILLHLATALSTIFVFRKEIGSLISQAFKPDGVEDRKYLFYIGASMIPATIAGVFFDDRLEAFYTGNIPLVLSCLVVTGALLLLADRPWKGDLSIDLPRSMTIGLAQMVALLPGISRSGSTIATALMLNVDRKKAARFSFLMVLPLIFGKVLLDVLSGDLSTSDLDLGMVLGFLVALFIGIWACRTMISLVHKSKLRYFAYYCFTVSIIGFISYFVV